MNAIVGTNLGAPSKGGSSWRITTRGRRWWADAYEAMRGLQDDFYEQVGSVCGLTRIGPKKQRVTREEWKAQKQQAKAMASASERFKEVELQAQEHFNRAEEMMANVSKHVAIKVDAAKKEALKGLEIMAVHVRETVVKIEKVMEQAKIEYPAKKSNIERQQSVVRDLAEPVIDLANKLEKKRSPGLH